MIKTEFNKDRTYTIEQVIKLEQSFKQGRRTKENIWKTIYAYDDGRFWDAIRKKLPKHQVLPDTNIVFYTGQNLVNSVYASPYIADLLPVNPEQQEESRKLNKFVEFVYNINMLGFKQLEMSHDTSRVNVGFMQLGWDNNKTIVAGDSPDKGDIEFIVRTPMQTVLDPNFKDFQEGRALFICTEDSVVNIIGMYPNSKTEIEGYFAKAKKDVKYHSDITNPANVHDIGKNYINTGVYRLQEGMLPVTVAYYKYIGDNGLKIAQITYINEDIILDVKDVVKPNYFPIVPLYETPPKRDPYAVGTVERILKNAMAINVLDSIATTHTYAAQRAPWILDIRSGISPREFKRDANNPGRVFLNRGEVRSEEVAKRLELPGLPDNLPYIRDSLEQSSEKVSGVDEEFTGRDTSSVQTTGGMERLQSRISMVDNTRIAMIEQYSKVLVKMMLDFYICYGGKRSFAINQKTSKEAEIFTINFDDYKEYGGEVANQIPMTINATPLLPKNRARLAEAANMIMQVQMQYQGEIKLLTPEEWLYYQDFPQKDMILDRMKLDRLRNDMEEITGELQSFMGMTEQGASPDDAVRQLADERAMRREPGVMAKQLNAKRK